MPEVFAGLTGYVLAGGRSQRMGQDKGDLRLGGKTLIELAIGKLQPLCDEVVIIGQRAVDGVRVIPDLHPGCGPIGGVEAALRDLPSNWAMFLPVDMPLLPHGLLRALCSTWNDDAGHGARVAFAVADGMSQPLVSVLHREVLRPVQDAVKAGQFKVRPVLEGAALAMAREAGVADEIVLGRTQVRTLAGDDGEPTEVLVGAHMMWQPTALEWRRRHLWFGNLNTPEEFREAERLVEGGV